MLVGGGPQIAMIEDNVSGVTYLSDALVQRAVQRAKRLKSRLAQTFRLTHIP